MPIDINSILSGGITDTISKLNDIVHSWITTKKDQQVQADDEQKLQAQIQQVMLDQQDKMNTAMNQVNLAEAENKSLLVSGWRPFVGWICGAGLGIQFIINPFATWICSLAGHAIQFPNLDMGTLVALLTGLLGMGGLRTYEKLNGVAAK